MREKNMGERREKIESKGAYAYDMHEAIRDVRRAFASDDYDRVGSCLNALRDICAPEIREAIDSEWSKIDKNYHDRLERVRKPEFLVHHTRGLTHCNHWKTDYHGNKTYHFWSHVSFIAGTGKLIDRNRRCNVLIDIWSDIYHERFRACIDCLDQHGELRKWRDVEYGKL